MLRLCALGLLWTKYFLQFSDITTVPHFLYIANHCCIMKNMSAPLHAFNKTISSSSSCNINGSMWIFQVFLVCFCFTISPYLFMLYIFVEG